MLVEEKRDICVAHYKKIRDHFSQPGAALSKTGGENEGMCRYRLDFTPSCPQRCAVGVLIPDEDYESDMDERGVLDDLLHSYPELAPKFGIATDETGYFLHSDPVYQFLCLAQGAHDSPSTKTPREFILALDGIAVRTGVGVAS